MKKREKKENFEAHIEGSILTSNSKKAYTLSKLNFFGEKKNEKVEYSLSEGFFLSKNKELKIFLRGKKLSGQEILNKFSKMDKKFPLKYKIFEDLRNKGFILKSGMKFGADFLVYEKGKKPGKNHSTWLLSIETPSKRVNWKEFILKNRVANSTKKRILIALQDEEGNIIYYEMNWKKI